MMRKNDVTSFFYYMWNKWSEEECMNVFGSMNMGKHFWDKWCYGCKVSGPSRAIPNFYSELNTEYQDMLVKRATECYDRRKELK